MFFQIPFTTAGAETPFGVDTVWGTCATHSRPIKMVDLSLYHDLIQHSTTRFPSTVESYLSHNQTSSASSFSLSK